MMENSKSKYKRLGKNTLLLFLGNFGSKFISIIMLPLYTRWLSVEDFGTVDIITVYVAFLLSIVTCCISESVFIYPKEQKKEIQREYFSSGLFFAGISFSITGILFLLINNIGDFYQISNNLFFDHIWLIYSMLFSMYILEYAQQFARSLDKIRVYSFAGIISAITNTILSVILIPKYGINGFIISTIGSNIFSAAFSLYFSKSYSYFSFKNIQKEKYKEMLHYSIPLIPNSIMWWIISSLNRPIMEGYLSITAIGIFAFSNKFPGILSTIFNVFNSSLQISAIEEFPKVGYTKFYNNVFRLVFVCLILLSCIMTVSSKIAVKIFASNNYYESWNYIPVLTLGFVFLAISGLLGSNFSAIKKSKYYFYSSIGGALSAIISNFILIPIIGIMGAAIAVILSYFVMTIIRLYFASKYVKIENIGIYAIMIFLNICVILVFLNITQPVSKTIMLLLIFIVLFLFIYRLMKDLIADYGDKGYFKLKFRK